MLVSFCNMSHIFTILFTVQTLVDTFSLLYVNMPQRMILVFKKPSIVMMVLQMVMIEGLMN